MKQFIRILTFSLAVLMLAGLLFGCKTKTVKPVTGGKPNSVASKTSAKALELNFAESYDDVKKALNELYSSETGYRDTMASGSATADNAMVKETSIEAPTSEDISLYSAEDEKSSLSLNSGKEYSETNVQVKGVDEGDIVKTDGEYIYILRDKNLSIVKADAQNTKTVSDTQIIPDDFWNDNSGRSVYANEMYVFGDRIAIIGEKYEWSNNKNDYKSSDYTDIFIVDISNRTSPQLIAESGQDGYINTSRLIGDKLYIISNYYVWSRNEDDPQTFIPRLYKNGVAETIAADDICIMPNISSESFIVVSAIDIMSGSIFSSQSVLGQTGTVYMNANSLYICSTRYDTEASEPYSADQYTVVDYQDTRTTDIIRFDISDGSVKVSASSSIPGGLVNQFALDEKDSYLRVVTTIDTSNYSVYTDEKYDFSNYKWGDSYSANCLYILDKDLKTVGSVENLAEDERVYSVRFDGDIGYFVTFRQVDPLFAVDLSNPENPTVLSSLKIPGFSEYLHIYSSGRLFGLGRDADEENGWAECIKLSMFDVSDPADVTECAHLNLEDYYWSVALYNHKAILICEDKDLIAFPVEDEYVVYGYSDSEGFYERASFKTDLDLYDARGIYIGDYIYICNCYGVSVFDMENFKLAASVKF